MLDLVRLAPCRAEEADLAKRARDLAMKFALSTGRLEMLHDVQWWDGKLAMLLKNPHNGGICTVILADREEIRMSNFLDRLQEYVERALGAGVEALKPRFDA